MINIDYHWVALIIIFYHWLSLIIIDYMKIWKRWLTHLVTTWNQEMLTHLKIFYCNKFTCIRNTIQRLYPECELNANRGGSWFLQIIYKGLSFHLRKKSHTWHISPFILLFWLIRSVSWTHHFCHLVCQIYKDSKLDLNLNNKTLIMFKMHRSSSF